MFVKINKTRLNLNGMFSIDGDENGHTITTLAGKKIKTHNEVAQALELYLSTLEHGPGREIVDIEELFKRAAAGVRDAANSKLDSQNQVVVATLPGTQQPLCPLAPIHATFKMLPCPSCGTTPDIS